MLARKHAVTAARLLFWFALAFALFMAWVPHPPPVPGNPVDKVQHMLAFGTLTILACAGYPGADLLRTGERLSFVGALIEVVQAIPALHRDCDIRDWAADTLIVAVVLVIVWVWRKRAARDPR